MLKQAENTIKIEGILSEIDLKYNNFVKNGQSTDCIGGTIKVLVEENGYDPREIPVYLFSTKYTKAGSLNPAYTSIESVMTTFKSIAATSKEEADRVRFTGSLRMNEYYAADGRLVSQPRVNTSFVNKVAKDFSPKADFVMTFMVSDIHRVTDSEGIEVDPAKLEVVVALPQYGGVVDVCKFYATNPDAIEGIESTWEPGYTYRAAGHLNFTSTTQVVKEEFGFGEAVEKVKTIRVNEFVITSGSTTALDDEFAFSIEDVKAAMAERKARLEASKDKASTKSAPAQTTSKGKLDLGF